MRTIRVLSFLLLTVTPLAAQRDIGINVYRGAVTVSGVLCGFDCNARDNVGTAAFQPLEIFGVRLIGEAGLPAALVFGFNGALPVCPGSVFPGIANSLLIDPTTLITGPVSIALTGPNRSCNANANEPILNAFTIPVSASGVTLVVQGLVHDNGQPAFTRPVEIRVN